MNAKSFKMFWEYWSSYAKHDVFELVSIARVMWTYKGDANSTLGENSKKLSSSTVLAETSFDDDSNKEAFMYIKFCQQ